MENIEMSTWANSIRQFINLPTAQLLTITVYGEAGNQGPEGMIAVLNVIQNRANAGGSFMDNEIYSLTGSRYHAVVLKYKQFSMFNPGDPVRTIAERIAGNFNGELVKNSALRKAYDLSNSLLAGELDDITGGADHYYNPSVVSPSWGASMPITTKVGDHLFLASAGGIVQAVTSTVKSIFSSIKEAIAPSAPVVAKVETYTRPEEYIREEEFVGEEGVYFQQAGMSPILIAGLIFGAIMIIGKRR